VRIFENVKFETSPILIAAWPGMGNVGLIAADYIRKKLDAQPFAEIDMTPYFIPEAVVVRGAIADFPKLPTAVIYYSRDPDILIFESDAQIIGKEGFAVAKSLMRFTADIGVKRVYTAAALPQNVSYRTSPQIYAAFTDKNVHLEFEKFNISPMVDGFIAGHNGTLLGIAKDYRIDGACFLGTIPCFAANMSYPKASLKIIELFEEILDIYVDKMEMMESIAIADSQFSAIEEKIKEFPMIAPDELYENTMEDITANSSQQSGEVIPQTIMEKIERLFQDAANDRNKAIALKKELDRWNVYELYEDRFLKLFK